MKTSGARMAPRGGGPEAVAASLIDRRRPTKSVSEAV